MANSISLTATGSEIVNQALEYCGVLEDGGSPTTTERDGALKTLAYMTKAWQARGTHLFSLQKMYVYLEKNKTEYTMGYASGDEFTLEDPFDNSATTSNAEIASATSIELEGSQYPATSDVFLIKLDDGSLHQDTVGTGGSSPITLDTGIASAAAAGSQCYWYTTRGSRPKSIDLAAVVKKPGSTRLASTETPVQIVTRKEFFELSQKGADGQVNVIYYDPGTISGTLYVWPQTDDVSDYLKLWVERGLGVESATGSTAVDYPMEWFNALSLNLAAQLCPKYGVPRDMFAQIYQLAQEARFDAESGDTEHEMFLQPDTRWR